MRTRRSLLSMTLLLALGAAGGAAAQSRSNAAVVPIFSDKSDSKPQAFLLLEPTDANRLGGRWRFGGSNALDAAFGLDAGDSLALLCNQKIGLSSALSNLTNNCAVGAIGDSSDGSGRHASATAAFSHNSTRLGLTAGTGRADLPAWLAPSVTGRTGTADVDVNDLTVFAQKNIGREGMVSIAGTMAKAQLIPAGELPADLAGRWDTTTLSVGGGYGSFGANIIGRVVDTPGRQQWQGVGLGLTWRTPWSGELTVGADNLITRGRNPFTPTSDPKQDEGAVPYVRYEQDL